MLLCFSVSRKERLGTQWIFFAWEQSTEYISVKKRVSVDFYSAFHILCKWQQLDMKQENCIVKKGKHKKTRESEFVYGIYWNVNLTVRQVYQRWSEENI